MSSDDLEEQLEWEERRADVPIGMHMVAGSCAGVAEHICMYPVDTFKVRPFVFTARDPCDAVRPHRCNPPSPPLLPSSLNALFTPPGARAPFCRRLSLASQTHLQSSGTSSFSAFFRANGFLRLWRGSPAVLLGCVPSHAAYFSAYEFGKARTGAGAPGHHPLAAALTGACATVLHDSVSAPMDMVKQRLQLGYYKGVVHCVRSIVAQDGAASLWRSFPTTLAMNVPYAAAVVAANESAKTLLAPLLGAGNLSLYLVSGAVAGATAGAATTPLDVVKTRLQTMALVGANVVPVAPLCGSCDATAMESAAAIAARSGAAASGGGLFATTLRVATALWATEGLRGFFRGAAARMAVNAPSQAISWASYEVVKGFLTSRFADR